MDAEIGCDVAASAEQAWFWSDRWQAMEREADEMISAGWARHVQFVEELLDELDS